MIAGAFAFGAALSAGAGDTVATLVESTPSAVPAASLPPEDAVQVSKAVAGPTEAAATPVPEQTPPAPVPAAQPLAEPEPVSALAPPATTAPAAPVEAGAVAEAVVPAPTLVVTEMPRSRPARPRVAPAGKSKARPRRRTQPKPLLAASSRRRQVGRELEAEVRVPGVDATIWLHRALPDPTPPAKRLSPSFAQRLRAVSRDAGVDWALVLGLLRARGHSGAVPAEPAALAVLAARISALRPQREDGAALALAGTAEEAESAVALAHYYRAVGLRALVRGLEWVKPRLEARIVRDDRIGTYDGGRLDITTGQVDVRVLVLIAYLADTYGEVTVSSLRTGHRLYARPGVISAHVYGLAVDVAALGGVPIAGHQEPGGLTEDAVRKILLLPSELEPRQVISLLGLGGPSFPMDDHGDHIHVGY